MFKFNSLGLEFLAEKKVWLLRIHCWHVLRDNQSLKQRSHFSISSIWCFLVRAGEKEGAGGLSMEMKRAAQEDATVSAPVLDLAKIFAFVILFKFKSGKKTKNVSLVQNFQCDKSKTGEIVFPSVLELIVVFISAKKWAEIAKLWRLAIYFKLHILLPRL